MYVPNFNALGGYCDYWILGWAFPQNESCIISARKRKSHTALVATCLRTAKVAHAPLHE